METNSLSTLKKLQNANLIPMMQITKLNCPNLHFVGGQNKKKQLVCTNNNIIAYLSFNSTGKADDPEGVIIFPNGAYYVGTVEKSKITGKGKLTNQAQMYSYEGQWSNGQPDGYGHQNISGNIYKGTFKDGKKDGKGCLTYSDGSVFQGTFKANQINGFGKHQIGQSQWKGFWRSGYLQGQGTQTIYNKNLNKSSVYIGWFIRGQKQGFGKFTWDRNRQYQGSFKRGQLHGEGVLRLAGRTYRGIWQQGTDLQIKEVNSNPSIIQFKRVEKNYKIEE